jgi:hypothetical protein
MAAMNMVTPVKANPPIEGDTIELGLGTATLVVRCGGAFVVTFTLDMLRDLDRHGIEPGQLSSMIMALEEKGRKKTWFRHGPRILG